MKYRFEITYVPKYLKTANEFMRSCDIWKEGEGAAYQYIMTFSRKGDEKPIDWIKNNIKLAFESAECELILIEGGKIE